MPPFRYTNAVPMAQALLGGRGGSELPPHGTGNRIEITQPKRPQVHRQYQTGLARLVDDTGDEASGNRLAQLDAIDAGIDRIYRGEAPRHPLLAEIAVTVRAFDVPPEPLRRLVQANRQDQTVRRYRTLDELVGYCELSANPVGHLVLYVFGSATPERLAL